MTERFNIKPSMMVTGKYVIIDELRQYTFPVLEPTMNHMFCKALNGLNNDREHLKQSHKEILRDLEVTTFDKELLQKENEQLRKSNKFLSDMRDVIDIVDENKQLKQFIKELTTKGTGRIDLASGYSYNVSAVLTDYKGDVE